MTTATHSHSTDFLRHELRSTHRPVNTATTRAGNATGVGGKSIASIVLEHCKSMAMPLCIIVEHLDAQVGTWQYSVDAGESWRTIRTDLINRPGYLGLALERTALLRVLPTPGGARSTAARMVFHASQRVPDDGSGSYQIYPADDRGEDACSISLALSLGAINGVPPSAATTRPRNKRALAAQRSAA